MEDDQKRCECGMPLDAKSTCECAGDKCVHCCECEDGCECNCKEKAKATSGDEEEK